MLEKLSELTTTDATTFRKLTTLEILSIGMLIKEKCHLHEGYALWDTGWSDGVVAKKFNVPWQSVSRLRREIVGQLPARGPGDRAGGGEWEEQVEARLAKLEEAMKGLL